MLSIKAVVAPDAVIPNQKERFVFTILILLKKNLLFLERMHVPGIVLKKNLISVLCFAIIAIQRFTMKSTKYRIAALNGAVAQRLEQHPYKVFVACSIHARPTTYVVTRDTRATA